MGWCNKLLHENLTEAAKRFPDNLAYKLHDDRLTYRQLDRESNKLAQLLISIGVTKGDRIGVFQHKTNWSAVSVYGILKSGCTFVPIDPGSPPDRFGAILDACDIRVLISQPDKCQFLERQIEHGSRLEYVVGVEDKGSSRHFHTCCFIPLSQLDLFQVKPVIIPDLRASDPAYIMFTSGSTGKPKGMIHTHLSGQAHVDLCVETYGLTDRDCLANHAPLHFDISTLGYLVMPRVGGRTVFVPESFTIFPANMAQLIETENITIWYSVPFALIQLLSKGALETRDFSRVRLVLFGGELISSKHLRALMDTFSEATFCNLYGPAETNNCTTYFLPQNLSGNESEIPIGRPLSGVEVQILDGDRLVEEQNQVGELWVKSPALMSGYWENPTLNEKVFREVSGGNGTTFRFYNTGDLASYGVDGNLMFHGRRDRLIKIRGNRIELDEIEAAICQFPGIQECAVYVADQHQDQERIEACVQARNDESINLKALRQYLVEKLPRYGIPDTITQVMSYPRTTSGKIDRVSLRAFMQTQNSGQPHN